jgi:dephospho-CoA kinase
MATLVLVVGMPGCGKGEFVAQAEQFGYEVLSLGDIVRKETLKRGEPVSESGRTAIRLREELGEAALAHCALPYISEEGKYIIDGIRSHAEVLLFKSQHNAIVVGIHTSPEERFRRLRGRGRADDPETRETFDERDARELGFGIGDAIALADHMLVNNRGIAAFHEIVREWLETSEHESGTDY